MADFACDPS